MSFFKRFLNPIPLSQKWNTSDDLGTRGFIAYERVRKKGDGSIVNIKFRVLRENYYDIMENKQNTCGQAEVKKYSPMAIFLLFYV